MATGRLLTLLICLTGVALSAAQPVRIALVGDSTVNDEGGWGPGFRASFAGGSVTVDNFAKNGRSSKSFRDEGLWKPVLDSKPDYVLIQFGHNDGPGKGPERETDPATTFRANLTRYVEEVRAAGGKPVLVTSIVRRNFDADGKLKRDSLVPWVEETRRLAGELRVPLMDLYPLTFAQTEALGANKADTLGAVLPDGKPDRTHLGALGQREVGVLAAKEFVRVVPAMQAAMHELVSWNRAMGQPKAWYGSAESVRIADNLLLYQNDNGGWWKNIDMAAPLGSKEIAKLKKERSEDKETTIDNGATWTQMQYLARVYSATKQDRFAVAFRKALRFVLVAQYPNGGWPQFYPLRKGYYTHITYNDNAMTGVLGVLRSIAERKTDYEFLNDGERAECREAVRKGVECILKTQIRVGGKLTVWCAQHDEVTLAPAKARSYELPSFSGSESVGVVRFLMGMEKPPAEVVAAIEGAVEWFRGAQIRGIRLEKKADPGSPKGWDQVVVADASAPPLWARFYDLKTGEAFFCGRDGVPKKTVAEIEYERRNGYRWYVDEPGKLLESDYPKWKARVAAGK